MLWYGIYSVKISKWYIARKGLIDCIFVIYSNALMKKFFYLM